MKIDKDKAAALGSVVEARNDIENSMGVAFGLDSATDIKSELTKVLTKLLSGAVISEAVDLLRGVKAEPGKFASLWDRYMPQIQTKDELMAAKHVLTDNRTSQDWKLFLNDPEIEKALIEDVGFRLLEDLSNIGTFLDKEKELVQDWSQKRPATFAFANQSVEDYVKKVFTADELREPKNKEGIDAFKLTRLAAYRTLDAHFTGQTTFEMTPHLGGAQTMSVKLKSPALTAFGENRDNEMAFRNLQYVKLGNVKTVEYDIVSKRPYRRLFESILKETDPRSYRGGTGGSFNASHPVQTLAQKICPLMAREAEYFRQKNFDPEVMYDLYAASKKLQFLSHSSLYPLLGTDTPPAQMPPDFVERFPKNWRQANGINLKALTFAGFTPIIHHKMKDIVDGLWVSLPEMKDELSQPETLDQLKLAKTAEIIVNPIKAAAVQREIAVAFKKSYPAEFDVILRGAEVECQQFKGDEKTYVIKLRNATLDKILYEMQKNPKLSVEDLEKKLLQDRTDSGFTFALPPSMVWARDLQTRSLLPTKAGQVDISR